MIYLEIYKRFLICLVIFIVVADEPLARGLNDISRKNGLEICLRFRDAIDNTYELIHI